MFYYIFSSPTSLMVWSLLVEKGKKVFVHFRESMWELYGQKRRPWTQVLQWTCRCSQCWGWPSLLLMNVDSAAVCCCAALDWERQKGFLRSRSYFHSMYRSTAVLHLHELQLENMPTNVFHRNLASYSLCQRTVRGNHFLQMKTVKQALILNKLWLSSTQHEWPAVTIQISQAGSLLNPTAVHSQSSWACIRGVCWK